MPAGPPQPKPRSRARLPRKRIASLPFVVNRGVDRQSIIIGIVGTILFHLLFVFAVPRLGLLVGGPDTAPSPNTDIDIQLAPDEPEVPQNKMKFVETNQEAPENIPDKSDNISGRNQQAANVKPPTELSPDKTPAREGQKDLPFDKVFSGTLDPQVTLPPAPSNPESEKTDLTRNDPTARAPLPGLEDVHGDSPDGLGSSVSDKTAHQAPVDQKIEGQDQKSPDTGPRVVVTTNDPERVAPAPRPRVQRATPGPIKEQPAGVTQTGYVGVNAHFSQYGAYLERVVEAVSQRWHSLCNSRSYGEQQTHLTLQFTITRAGMIKDMSETDVTAKPLGVLLCRSAVEGGQSYGEWTPDMVSVLGDEQTVSFSFYYW